ncbi:MAG: 50S ribosomal protein L11 [Nanoarchaeota archaeon]
MESLNGFNKVIIKLLIDGGEMKPGPAIAQQLGPKGINIGKVISYINDATKSFKGMKVPVELDVDEKTKDFSVKTFSPPTSELIKSELKLEKGSAKISEIKVGNASIEDIIKIAKIKHTNMLEKDLKKAVKSVLGTAASVGILVENNNPVAIVQEVEQGKFDKEITAEKTETTTEKRNALQKYFTDLKSAQEAKAAAAAALEEAAKAAAEAAAKPVAGAAPAATAATGDKKIDAKVAAVPAAAGKAPATAKSSSTPAKAASKPAAKKK